MSQHQRSLMRHRSRINPPKRKKKTKKRRFTYSDLIYYDCIALLQFILFWFGSSSGIMHNFVQFKKHLYPSVTVNVKLAIDWFSASFLYILLLSNIEGFRSIPDYHSAGALNVTFLLTVNYDSVNSMDYFLLSETLPQQLHC